MAQSQTEVDYERIPSHMRDGMRRYIEQGTPPGGFARAVLTNDLTGAFGRADSRNREALGEWVGFLTNEVPARAWGDEETVQAWIQRGGLEGL